MSKVPTATSINHFPLPRYSGSSLQDGREQLGRTLELLWPSGMRDSRNNISPPWVMVLSSDMNASCGGAHVNEASASNLHSAQLTWRRQGRCSWPCTRLRSLVHCSVFQRVSTQKRNCFRKQFVSSRLIGCCANIYEQDSKSLTQAVLHFYVQGAAE